LVRTITGQTGVPTIDKNKPMDEPGQKFNASTLYFNAGLRIDFDLIKKRESKLESSSARYTPKKSHKSTKEKAPSKSKKSKGSKTMLDDPDSKMEVK